MFEDFREKDISEYLTKHKANNNQELIKANFLNEVEDNKPAVVESDELFKGWDRSVPYSEYLSKRRGDMIKNNPIFKMVSTEIHNEQQVSTPEESMFSDLKEGENTNINNYLFKNQVKSLEDSTANAMWLDEKNGEVVKKTMQAVASLYKKYVIEAEEEVTEESLIKNLMENHNHDEASAKVVAATLIKAKTYRDDRNSEGEEEK